MRFDRLLFIQSSFLSILGFVLYPLIIDSYFVWFGKYDQPFESSLSFLSWFWPIPITAFLVGVLYPEGNDKNRVLVVAWIILFLFTLLGLLTGSVFTMEQGTQEYILHFLNVQTMAVFYAFAVGMHIRTLLHSEMINDKNKWITAVIAFGVGWMFSIVLNVLSFSVFQSWVVISLSTGSLAFLFFRNLNHLKNDHENI